MNCYIVFQNEELFFLVNEKNEVLAKLDRRPLYPWIVGEFLDRHEKILSDIDDDCKYSLNELGIKDDIKIVISPSIKIGKDLSDLIKKHMYFLNVFNTYLKHPYKKVVTLVTIHVVSFVGQDVSDEQKEKIEMILELHEENGKLFELSYIVLGLDSNFLAELKWEGANYTYA